MSRILYENIVLALIAVIAVVLYIIYDCFKQLGYIPSIVLDVEAEIRRIAKWTLDHIIKQLGKKLVELFGKLIDLLGGITERLKAKNKETTKRQNEEEEDAFRQNMAGEYKRFSDAIYRFGNDNESKLDIDPPASSTSVRVKSKEKISGNLSNVVFRYKLCRKKHFDIIHKQEYPLIAIGDIEAKLREELPEYANDAGYQFSDVRAYDEDETKIESTIIVEVSGVWITPEEAQRRYRQNGGNGQNWQYWN